MHMVRTAWKTKLIPTSANNGTEPNRQSRGSNTIYNRGGGEQTESKAEHMSLYEEDTIIPGKLFAIAQIRLHLILGPFLHGYGRPAPGGCTLFKYRSNEHVHVRFQTRVPSRKRRQDTITQPARAVYSGHNENCDYYLAPFLQNEIDENRCHGTCTGKT